MSDKISELPAGQVIGAVSGKLIYKDPDNTSDVLSTNSTTIISVMQYGAIGDGVTDDTDAIQDAMDAIATAGGTIFFPNGKVFGITADLTVSGSAKIKLYGNGNGSVIRAIAGFSGNGILGISNSNSVFVDGIEFDGNKSIATGMSNDDVYGLIYLLTPATGFYSITNNTIVNAIGGGITTYTATGVTFIKGNTILNTNKYAMFLRHAGGGQVTENYIDGADANGIYYEQFGSTLTSKKVIIANNIVKNITDNNESGSGAAGNGINTFNLLDVVISNNNIDNCEFSAIRCSSSQNIVISGNYCKDSGETAIYGEFVNAYINITGNQVNGFGIGHNSSLGGTGISCTNFQTNNGRAANISGNTIINGYGVNYGIVAEADCIVNGNMIDGCAYGIIAGTNQFLRNVVVSNNLIQDKYAPAWTISTAYPSNSKVTANGNVYTTAVGGTSSGSGGGPSGTGSSITDGTVTWAYVKVSTPLQVGIWPSNNTGAAGYAIVENNHIYDFADHAIYGQTYTPPYTDSTFVSGSLIYLSGNYPGITHATLPPTAGGGSNVYETDTGAYRIYDDVHSKWMNLAQISGSATFDPGSVSNGAGVTSSGITVTGAALGDIVVVGAPYDLLGVVVTGYVSAANTVKIRVQNGSGSSFAPGSGTWQVKVLKV